MNPSPFSPTPPGNISVVEPIEPALERTKNLLFRPFDLQKWFVVGFGAWLAELGENGGMGGGFNFPGGGSGSRSRGGPNMDRVFENMKEFVLNNLAWLVPLAVFLVLLSVGLGLVILWLNSRGKFMLLHCAVLNRAEVAEPWRIYAKQANSLFVFRLCVSIAGFVLMIPLLVLGAVVTMKMFAANRSPDFASVMVVAGLIGLFIGVVFLFALVRKLTTDFVVPIMYLRSNTCLDAWKELWALIAARFGKFALYLVFQIVLGMVIGSLVLAVILVTCCLALCLMAIPYIGAVVMLPVTSFKRYYSLQFLAQFGPEYNVFAPSAAGTSSNAPSRGY